MAPSESLQTTIGGDLWWGGFTADLAITNTSDQDLDGWTISFISRHQLDPNAWGVALASESLGNGLTRYTLDLHRLSVCEGSAHGLFHIIHPEDRHQRNRCDQR